MAKKTKEFRHCHDAKDFVEYAEYYGAIEDHCRGDHHIFVFPNGQECPIPYKRMSDPIKDGTKSGIKKLFRLGGAVVGLLIALYYIYPAIV